MEHRSTATLDVGAVALPARGMKDAGAHFQAGDRSLSIKHLNPVSLSTALRYVPYMRKDGNPPRCCMRTAYSFPEHRSLVFCIRQLHARNSFETVCLEDMTICQDPEKLRWCGV